MEKAQTKSPVMEGQLAWLERKVWWGGEEGLMKIKSSLEGLNISTLFMSVQECRCWVRGTRTSWGKLMFVTDKGTGGKIGQGAPQNTLQIWHRLSQSLGKLWRGLPILIIWVQLWAEMAKPQQPQPRPYPRPLPLAGAAGKSIILAPKLLGFWRPFAAKQQVLPWEEIPVAPSNLAALASKLECVLSCFLSYFIHSILSSTVKKKNLCTCYFFYQDVACTCLISCQHTSGHKEGISWQPGIRLCWVYSCHDAVLFHLGLEGLLSSCWIVSGNAVIETFAKHSGGVMLCGYHLESFLHSSMGRD